MMSSVLEVAKRARFDRRVERNDARALDAATIALAESGWGGLTLLSVAKHAGLSKRASSDRFIDREGIGIGLWQSRLGAIATHDLRALLAAAGLLDAAGSPADFADALRRFGEPTAELRCIGELLVVAHFHPRLRAVIDADLGAMLRGLCTPSRHVTAARAAQRAIGVALGLGLLLTTPRRDGAATPHDARYYHALQHPSEPSPLPDVAGFTPRGVIDFGSGETRMEALLNAALEVMSQAGYDGATTMALVQHAGYSEGTLFARYPSKAALFIDAIVRLQARAIPENAALLAPVAERYGAAIAQAVDIRATLSPERWRGRHLALEYERLAATQPLVRTHARSETTRWIAAVDDPPGVHPHDAVVAGVHMALALGIGIALLPGLLPEVHTLPFDVVTVPLSGG
jgi:AcrR family transcriptional regulator